MKRIFKILLFVCFLVFISCKQQESSSISAISMPEKNKNTDNLDSKRKIIKNGEIHFESDNIAQTRKIIFENVKELDGYISDDRVANEENKVEYHITIRVPSSNFDLLLNKISENAENIDSKNVSATDVTEEFIDIEARIKTKKELEFRYKELLLQAKKVEELLAIEKELGTLRSDIESIEGRLKFINNNIELSTLTIVFYDHNTSSFNLSDKIFDGLQNGWSIFLWLIVGLVNLWPFLIIVLMLLSFLKWRRDKKKKRSHNS